MVFFEKKRWDGKKAVPTDSFYLCVFFHIRKRFFEKFFDCHIFALFPENRFAERKNFGCILFLSFFEYLLIDRII